MGFISPYKEVGMSAKVATRGLGKSREKKHYAWTVKRGDSIKPCIKNRMKIFRKWETEG